MRAPPRGREAIIADAIKLLAPPADLRDIERTRIADYLVRLQVTPREHIRVRDIKKNLEAYEKALRAARKASAALWQIHLDMFVEQIDEQVAMVERYKAKAMQWGKDKGAKLTDLDAEAAVQIARNMLDERGMTATASPKSAWHRLSQLFYEGITGMPNKDMMYYLRNWKPDEGDRAFA